MKFDSPPTPRLPTPQQITELHDLIASGNELLQIYSRLEFHPRITTSPKALELFASCREQLQQDLAILKSELARIGDLPRSPSVEPLVRDSHHPAAFAQEENEAGHSLPLMPDVEPIDVTKSVFETVKRSFGLEGLFSQQLATSLRTAQHQNHLRLELQLKMIKLSCAQRNQLLEDRYGYARSKNVLFQDLRRQTTRFLSAISGEKRNDIDR